MKKQTPNLSELPTGTDKTERVREIFDTIAPRYDLVNRLMTLGLDQIWRRKTVNSLQLPKGSLILDLACGTGDLGTIARHNGYQTIGADLSEGMLRANNVLLKNQFQFILSDATQLPLIDGAVDGIVCGYALRNFTDLGACLDECARVTRPGGRLCILEVCAPQSRLLRAGYDVWFERVVPWLGGILSDREAYRYLPKSTQYLPSSPELLSMIHDCGFSMVQQHLLNAGISQLITATRSGIPR